MFQASAPALSSHLESKSTELNRPSEEVNAAPEADGAPERSKLAKLTVKVQPTHSAEGYSAQRHFPPAFAALGVADRTESEVDGLLHGSLQLGSNMRHMSLTPPPISTKLSDGRQEDTAFKLR